MAIDPPAGFDGKLAILDLSLNMAAGADSQAAMNDDVSFDPTGDLGLGDLDLAAKQSILGDFQPMAVANAGVDGAFHDEMVAGDDLARKRNVTPDDQFSCVAGVLGARGLGSARRHDRR